MTHQVEEVELIHFKNFRIEQLNEWPSLKSLKVDSVDLMLTQQADLSNFTLLERLELKNLNLVIDVTGLIELLQNSLCSLQKLTINDCRPSIDHVLQCIGAVKTLKHLDIAESMVGGDGLEGLVSAIELPCSLKTLAVSQSLFVEEGGLKEAAIQRVVRALQHQNACLEKIAVFCSALEHDFHLESNFAPFTTINWAGRRLLSGNRVVPAGLWPLVIARMNRKMRLV